MSATIACTPRIGPGRISRNAHCHPTHSAAADVSLIDTIVSRNPRQVCTVRAVPRYSSSVVSETMAENCAESATTETPHTAASRRSTPNGAWNAGTVSAQQVALTIMAHAATLARPRRSAENPAATAPIAPAPMAAKAASEPRRAAVSAPRGVGAQRRILALHIFENYNQYKRLMAFTPGQVEYLSSDTGYSDIGTVSGSDDSVVSAVNIDNKMVFTLNDDPTIRSWDGMTYGNLVDDAAIRARYLMKHKIWLMLVRPLQFVDGEWVERYAEVWPSYPGDVDSFTEEDRVMIDADGAINGCRPLADSPIVYFPGSIHRVYLINAEDGFASVPITDTDGLMCSRTLTGGRDTHYFMSKRGMMGMRLGSAPVPLSWSKFNKLIIDGIDPLYYDKAVARFYEDSALLYVAFPPAGQAGSSAPAGRKNVFAW